METVRRVDLRAILQTAPSKQKSICPISNSAGKWFRAGMGLGIFRNSRDFHFTDLCVSPVVKVHS